MSTDLPKRKRGREKTVPEGCTMGIFLTVPLIARIDKYCAKTNQTRSQFVRGVIRDALNQLEKRL